MKFLIETSPLISNAGLNYLEEECSFYMGPIQYDIQIEFILNQLSLACSNDTIVHVSGFCGLANDMNSNICIPRYSKGRLKVEHNLKSGFAYGITDEDLPVYLNIESGWVSIGDPLKLGNAVEFIDNCVAVINDLGEFSSLWLKPKSLPKFLWKK